MRIILEGPDNSGKTTLANRIKHALGDHVTYFHPGGRPVDESHETKCLLDQDTLIRQFDRIVVDRLTAISQRVYQPNAARTQIRIDALNQLLCSGAIVIYCRPSTDRLLRIQDFTWRDEETEEFKQEIIANHHTYVNRYDELMQTVPCITYDFEDPTAEVIYQKILQGMHGDREAQMWFVNLINLSG